MIANGRPLVDVFADEEVREIRHEVYDLLERCYLDSPDGCRNHEWYRALPVALRPWAKINTSFGSCMLIHMES